MHLGRIERNICPKSTVCSHWKPKSRGAHGCIRRRLAEFACGLLLLRGNSTLPKLQVAQKKLSFPGLFEVPRFIRRKMNGRGRYAKLINWLPVCVGWSRRQWWFSCALKWPREDAAISSSLFGWFRDGTSQVVTTWGRRETYVLLGKIICQNDTEKEIAVFHFCQAI